ncbi:hypothetical protein PV516_19245 [Streptomyces scabiei]|uniref:hypothetical protein n=1 Tax=Streptomyces scabiei TaxID=1930 RepID=UPI0029A0313A|nr:hypothetical protein [Streptomyces scabiei]MDX3165925.1 hypothetical protein [Streptomyces scabiei]
MTENTATEHMTGAERMDHEQLEDRIRYAVRQLKEGKFLTITNGPDGEVDGTCGHDPRAGRDWLLHLFENRAAR